LKVIQIAGFLGSGKTTTIIALSKKISADRRKRVAVIVNEIGQVPVDAKVLGEYGLRVMEIGQGCICCEVASSMAFTIKELGETFKPELVLVEPTGVALPEQVKGAVELGCKYTRVEIGKVVVLFDALRGEELLAYDELKEFVMRQLNNAEIIAINKIDAATEEQLDFCERKLANWNPKAEIIRISASMGIGIEELMKKIV